MDEIALKNLGPAWPRRRRAL